MSVLSNQLQRPLSRLSIHEQCAPSVNSTAGIHYFNSVRKHTFYTALSTSFDFNGSLRHRVVAKASGTVPDNVTNECPEFSIERLEAYTDKVPGEVLCVHAEVDGEEEQVIIFKGFSSSLTGKTPDDPSDPLLLPSACIKGVDRIRAPYRPSNVEYIAEFIPWADFNNILISRGL